MISKEKWVEAIRDFHEKGVPELIERDINIPTNIPLKRAITIIGPRRAGKTYVMYQTIGSLLKDKIETTRIFYINFERTDLENCSSNDLDIMLKTFFEIYPQNKNKKIWVFLDELQNVIGWEKFVRTSIDNENIQIFISGSSSKMLSKEIASSLRGRTITYKILPFSFKDYLSLENIEAKKYMSSSEKAKVINALERYMKEGGYPEAIIYRKEKEKILLDIVETTIYKDVIDRYKIRNTKLLKLLIQSMINSSQREFSINKFFKFTKSMGIKASKNSLYKYVDALNDVFFAFTVRKFSYSYRDAEQSLPKIYLIDNGLLTANGITYEGRLMENLVFIELMRKENNIYYYKSVGDKEVDFVILKNAKPSELIQVAFSLDDPDTREREIKAILKASDDLKCNNMKIITWNDEKKEKIAGKNINYIPLWKWLLE